MKLKEQNWDGILFFVCYGLFLISVVLALAFRHGVFYFFAVVLFVAGIYFYQKDL